LVFLEVKQNVKAKAFSAFLRIIKEMEAVGFLVDMNGLG